MVVNKEKKRENRGVFVCKQSWSVFTDLYSERKFTSNLLSTSLRENVAF